jgi:hypothetical protein
MPSSVLLAIELGLLNRSLDRSNVPSSLLSCDLSYQKKLFANIFQGQYLNYKFVLGHFSIGIVSLLQYITLLSSPHLGALPFEQSVTEVLGFYCTCLGSKCKVRIQNRKIKPSYLTLSLAAVAPIDHALLKIRNASIQPYMKTPLVTNDFATDPL